jgi:hypothetical protein
VEACCECRDKLQDALLDLVKRRQVCMRFMAPVWITLNERCLDRRPRANKSVDALHPSRPGTRETRRRGQVAEGGGMRMADRQFIQQQALNGFCFVRAPAGMRGEPVRVLLHKRNKSRAVIIPLSLVLRVRTRLTQSLCRAQTRWTADNSSNDLAHEPQFMSTHRRSGEACRRDAAKP